MTLVATVLRTGGRYTREHVRMLEDQLGPQVPLTVFTDDEQLLRERGQYAVKLRRNYPGWWSKMELFDPDTEGDIIYFDLDTAFIRRPKLLLHRVDVPMILRDVYRPEGLQSSVMCIPQYFKTYIWDQWMLDPSYYMKEFKDGGDQAFIEYCGKQHWELIQQAYPGEYISWKADGLADGREPPTFARVIVFHGEPKPWDIPNAKRCW